MDGPRRAPFGTGSYMLSQVNLENQSLRKRKTEIHV